ARRSSAGSRTPGSRPSPTAISTFWSTWRAGRRSCRARATSRPWSTTCARRGPRSSSGSTATPSSCRRPRDALHRRARRPEAAARVVRLVPLRARRARLCARREHRVREPPLRRRAEQGHPPRQRRERRGAQKLALRLRAAPVAAERLLDLAALRLLLLLPKLEFESPLHPARILTRPACFTFVTRLSSRCNTAGLGSGHIRPGAGVVGAGVLGSLHALAALRRGHDVVHLEREQVGRGASIRNFGLVWVSGRRPGAELALALRSRALWDELGRQIPDLGFRPNGSLTLLQDEAEPRGLEQAVGRED